jgi:hypothetical protein
MKKKLSIDQRIAKQKKILNENLAKEKKISALNKQKQTLARLKNENFKYSTAGKALGIGGKIASGLGSFAGEMAKNQPRRKSKPLDNPFGFGSSSRRTTRPKRKNTAINVNINVGGQKRTRKKRSKPKKESEPSFGWI